MRRNILLQKAKLFFKEHPNKTSTILKIKNDDVLTHWQVQRKNGQLHITEINSKKNKIVISEAGTAILPPYDPNKTGVGGQSHYQPMGLSKPSWASTPAELPTMSRQTSRSTAVRHAKWKLDSPVGEFAKTLSKTKNLGTTLNTAFDDLSKEFGSEHGAVNAMNDYLNPIGQKIATKTDLNKPDLQKKVGSYLSQLNPNLKRVIPTLPMESKKIYRITLKEAGEDSFKGALDEPEDQNQDQSQHNPEQSLQQSQKTSEEKAIEKLNGQTIKNASVDVDEGIVRLSLQLAGTQLPVDFIVEKTGKVTFVYKGSKYILRK